MSWARIVILVGALLATAAVIWAIYHAGGEAQGNKVAVQVERQHTQAVTDARTDERAAQASSDHIGDATAITNAESTRTLETILEGMKNDLAAAKAAGGDAAGVDVPVPDSVRLASNAGIDRANRAADAAEAAARAAAR